MSSNTQLRTTLVQGDAGFESLRASWLELASCDESSTVFNGWHWNRLWWNHYGSGCQLHIVLVHDDHTGELLGIAPFYRVRLRVLKLFHAETLRFIGSGGDTSPDDLDIIARSARRDEVADCVCRHLIEQQSIERLWLNDMPAGSALAARLVDMLKASGTGTLKVTAEQRRHATLPATWDAYRQQISRNTHKQIKRRRNRLDKVANARIAVCETLQQVDRARLALIDLHRARWQSKGQKGAFRSQQYIEFHRELMLALFERNELWLVTLEVQDQIVGVEYAFCVNNTLAFFQTGFNPQFEHLSPGHVMITYAIERAINRRISALDLLKGDYNYKASYAADVVSTVTVDYTRPGLLSVVRSLRGALSTHR